MEPAQAQVCIVDDDVDICRSVTAVLASVGYSISAYATAEEYLGEDIHQQPHCLIADLLLPGMTGLKLCRHVVVHNPACGCIIISGNADVASAVQAIRMGALDVLEKPFKSEKLLDSVHAAIQEVAARSRRRDEEEDAWRRFEKLTSRERNIFSLVAAGHPTKTIARSCGISTRTVDVHRSRILQKLQIESSSQLANLIGILDRTPGGRPKWATS
jgi:FixJ family two-component response regulator